MTVFGWDSSHFDGPLTPSILARARSEGNVFFTHKIGEGLLDTEGGTDDTALAAARTAGFPLIGGYLVPRSNATVEKQVDYWIKLADAGEPWWRNFPGWFWQIDLERWPTDAVPASVGIEAAQLLRAKTGRWTILYASQGQYGDQLKAWDGPLWNAHYVSGAYPGDGWAPGWGPYSGKESTFLQYTSGATIAGLTTCDRNAYRGTLAQLLALVAGGAAPNSSPGGPVVLGDDDIIAIADAVAQWATVKGALPATHIGARVNLNALAAKLDSLATAVAKPPTITLSADQLAQLVSTLEGLVPTLDEIDTAVDKAVKARLDGASIHTAGS